MNHCEPHNFQYLIEVGTENIQPNSPFLIEDTVGSLEVRELFKISRVGTIAGSYVVSGLIKRGLEARVVRDGKSVYTGKIVTLRRFTDDVREVETGFECGVRIEGFNDIKVGDIVEAIEQRKVAKKLSAPTENSASELPIDTVENNVTTSAKKD